MVFSSIPSLHLRISIRVREGVQALFDQTCLHDGTLPQNAEREGGSVALSILGIEKCDEQDGERNQKSDDFRIGPRVFDSRPGERDKKTCDRWHEEQIAD